MPNIAAVLKDEIRRLARKEIREQVGSLKKTVHDQRSAIAELKRQDAELRRRLVAYRYDPTLPSRWGQGG